MSDQEFRSGVDWLLDLLMSVEDGQVHPRMIQTIAEGMEDGSVDFNLTSLLFVPIHLIERLTEATGEDAAQIIANMRHLFHAAFDDEP